MAEEPILNIHKLKTYFFTEAGVVKAVDGINLRVEKGEIMGLVGESGSGKSVTALSVLRIVPPPGRTVEGQVKYKGKDIMKYSENEMTRVRGREIAMIFQDPATSLNPVYTIGQQLSEIYSVHNKVTKKESRERVIKMLELVKMSEPEKRVDQYPHELSGGMRQRIAIARALLCDPSLLFADEPTTNLDVTIQAQILDLLNELKKVLGSSLVMITHDMGIVADLTARIQVLYAGRVCEIGLTKEVFKKPKHPYTEALLRAVPHMMISSSERLNVIPGNIPNLVDPPKGCRFHPRCSFAIERCKDKMPDLEEVSSGCYSACIRWQELELEGVSRK